MKFNYIERPLQRFFYKYGGFVAEHPLPFIFLPLIMTGALASGLLFITVETDTEILYSPTNSPSQQSREFVEDTYSQFNNSLLPRHATRLPQYLAIIIQPKQGIDNILNPSVIAESRNVDAFVRSVSVEDGNQSYSFSDLCIMWKGQCHTSSQLLSMLSEVSFDSSGSLIRPITYPFWYVSGGRPLPIAPELAGVTLKNNSDEIDKVEYIQLAYWIRKDKVIDEVGLKWQNEVHKQLDDNVMTEFIDVYAGSLELLASNLDEASNTAILLVGFGFAMSILFAVVSTLTADNVRSKPWLATLGSASTGLATASGFGFMAYVGLPYTHIVGVVPFLILGIGLDDMYLMVAAWRQTDINKPNKDRMSEALSHAAISITITTVTDALAFGVGSFTNFYSVTLFCAYAGVSIVFDYIYQITFFAACMALTGFREEKNLHALTCRKVLPKSEAPSKFYSICCAGGTSEKDSSASTEEANAKRDNNSNNDHLFMWFFKNFFGPVLTHPVSVTLTIFLYLAYLGSAIWGITQIQEGLPIHQLTPPGSKSSVFFKTLDEHFTKYGSSAVLVVTEELEYSRKQTQDRLIKTIEELEESEYFWDSRYTTSWLREYQGYLQIRDRALGTTLSDNITEEQFILILKEEFLIFPQNEQFIPDIVFDEGGKSIISSRSYVTTRNVNTPVRERDMYLELQSVVRSSSLPMVAQGSSLVHIDQYVEILPSTFRGLGIALAVMFVVALFMIPHPVCSIIVTASLVSIVVGLAGFLSLWDVSLDFFSLIALIACIGFSVDYVAHVSYAYVSSQEASPRKRAIYALYTVGMPITQAAASTIFACLPLVLINAYIFQTLFKAFFMVSLFGVLHGLVFVPVFLMLLIRK